MLTTFLVLVGTAMPYLMHALTTQRDDEIQLATAAYTLFVASFPVEMDDQIMLATSKGQSIRVPVEGISFRSRSAGGVKVFNTGKGEEVVSVAWIADQGDEDVDDEDQGGGAADS